MKKDGPVVIKRNYDFERVDIFLRVEGRLPNREGDSLTQEILDKYCRRFEAGTLTMGMVPLRYMYDLIKSGEVEAYKKEVEK